MPAVETTNLRKEYGEVVALDGLDLTVERGELYGLLGPNGSGKTTTIEILTGQRAPTAGSAAVLDVDRFVGDVRDIDEVDERIERWAEKLEFRGVLDTLSTDLSEGERQRVMLAQVFVHEPDLAFIDEPLVNLDPLMQADVKSYLQEYCAEGNTLFLSTHFMEVAEQLCTSVGIISEGELVAERDPQALEEGLLETFAAEVDRKRAEIPG
jgi:ABC-2 type transport system ATP-binding protein